MSLGYEYAGRLEDQTNVEADKVYLAYTTDVDSSNHVTFLCNISKSWTLGDDNIDSDFEEMTGKGMNEKVEKTRRVVFQEYTDISNDTTLDFNSYEYFEILGSYSATNLNGSLGLVFPNTTGTTSSGTASSGGQRMSSYKITAGLISNDYTFGHNGYIVFGYEKI